MRNKTLEADTLDILARKIVHCSEAIDGKHNELVNLVRAAYDKVKNGEAGDTTWSKWAKKNLSVGPSRLRELTRIAKASDPTQEVARQRGANAARQKRHRAKIATTMPLRNGGSTRLCAPSTEPEREQLMSWVDDAAIEDVRLVLEYIDDGLGDEVAP